MTLVAGLRLVLEPDGSLSPQEREWLLDLPPTPARSVEPVVRIRLEPLLRKAGTPEAPPAPARVAWEAGRLRLRHEAFEADLDPAAGAAIVRRDSGSATGLATTLRMAVSARLPLEGGVLLHAAGLEHAGSGLVFFGPSGIGKSTLAERSPWPTLSDELVAALPRRESDTYRVAGAFPEPAKHGLVPSTAEPPLACLIELAKGPRFELKRLAPAVALRRLLGSIVVPPSPLSWIAALAVASDLVRQVACYRMAWSLSENPFPLLEAARSGHGQADESLSSARRPPAGEWSSTIDPP